MCYPTTAGLALQEAIANGCPAKALLPTQRQRLALQALAGSQTITDLANQCDVSRKFVYQQSRIADAALSDAFAPQPVDDQVLFHLPVTQQWLRQLTLGLVLVCLSPLRGVVELMRDLFDHDVSVGTVFNIVHAAVAPARACNQRQELSRVRVGAHDEIFQAGQPVLVGADALSSYCYLLSLEEHRDWGVHLLDLHARGFQPDYVVADAANALRAAQGEVLPDVPCRSDVFHALQEVHEVVTNLHNRAYDAMTTCTALELRIARDKQQGRPADHSCVKQRSDATKVQAQAMALADDVALLARWLRYDVLGLAGPSHADRLVLYDFIGRTLLDMPLL